MRLLLFTLILILPSTLLAESLLENHFGHCCKHHLFEWIPAEPGAPAPVAVRKFARDRLIDVHHLRIDLTPDFAKRTIAGVATINFSPISAPLKQLTLDAVDLEIHSIDASTPLRDYDVADETITLTFENPVPAGEKSSVTITYTAEPFRGLYFRTPEMGYPEGDTHLWTQGQPESHRHWFPGYDYPNERFTSEVRCQVPEGMTALSNGALISEKKDPSTGLVTFHWRQDKPHVNYLISVVAGYLEKLEDHHGDLPLAFYTVPSDFDEAANSFRDTAKILAFFEREIGVPYPWDKYYNVVVKDFIAGGMENTSITTLTDRTLFTTAHENLRTSHRLDAHEVAHQWFGDLLTCKDWSHIWLNEGFATFYQVLYEGEKFGADALLFQMHGNADEILKAKDDKPIVYREYEDPKEQFDYRAYPKGAWVLHMLRSQLGPDLYRRCIQAYIERNANRNFVTEDLNRVIEEISGRSFDRFFDQWVYHGGMPELDIKYSWDGLTSQAKITVDQKQKLSDRVPLFHLQLPIRFTTGEGTHDFTIDIDEATEDFFFKLPAQPKTARIDPGYTILAKINFTPPSPLLDAQLDDETDMIGRLLAIQVLSKKKDKESIDRLAETLRADAFYGVRIEAAKALKTIHNDAAFAALRGSLNQDDARVRLEVVRSLASFYRQEARETLEEISSSEKNPEIVAAAVAALGQYPVNEVQPALLAALERSSYRNEISQAAVSALHHQGDPVYLDSLLERLRDDGDSFTTDGLGNALNALAYLARDTEEETREPVRRFIASRLDDPRERIRARAIDALGGLEDPRSLPLLENYPVEPAARPENKAAAAAIRKLNAAKPQATEVTDLRNEVLEMKKKLSELREELETLEKKTTPEKPEEEDK